MKYKRNIVKETLVTLFIIGAAIYWIYMFFVYGYHAALPSQLSPLAIILQ